MTSGFSWGRSNDGLLSCASSFLDSPGLCMGAVTRMGDPTSWYGGRCWRPSSALSTALPSILVLGPGDAVGVGIDSCALSDEATMLVRNIYQESKHPNDLFLEKGGKPSTVPSAFAHMGMSRSPEWGSLG